MKYESDGLVLKVSDVGESDRVISVLTREYGLIRAFANGAKRYKSSSQSATQALCYSHFIFHSSRDSYVIDEAKSIETFFRLREDIEKLSLAQYFCELCEELAPEMDEANDYLRLALNCLHMLVTEKRSPLFLKATAELRMLSLAGYMPELNTCGVCGKGIDADCRFDVSNGVLTCTGCSASGFPVTIGTVYAMRHICYAPFEKLFSFEMKEDALKHLSGISEKYLKVQTNKSFKALEFYNKLFF